MRRRRAHFFYFGLGLLLGGITLVSLLSYSLEFSLLVLLICWLLQKINETVWKGRLSGISNEERQAAKRLKKERELARMEAERLAAGKPRAFGLDE